MTTIVHIDDEQMLIDLTELALRPLNSRFIGLARSAAGLETVRFVRPDLVILDVMMPEIDGWEVLSRVKSDPFLRGVKVLMYSALGNPSDIRRGQALGADLYMTKPCAPDRMLEVAAGLLGITGVTRKGGTMGTSASNLPSTDVSTVPAIVYEFVDRYLETTVALEVVNYLHDQGQWSLTAALATRALRRKPAEVQDVLERLVNLGLLTAARPDDGGEMVYTLAPGGKVQSQIEEFLRACQDPDVRAKALYRIIRRRNPGSPTTNR